MANKLQCVKKPKKHLVQERRLPFSTNEVPQFVTYVALSLQGCVNVNWSCQIRPIMHCNSKKTNILRFDKHSK